MNTILFPIVVRAHQLPLLAAFLIIRSPGCGLPRSPGRLLGFDRNGYKCEAPAALFLFPSCPLNPNTMTTQYSNGRTGSFSESENRRGFPDDSDTMAGLRTELSVQQDIRAQIRSPNEHVPYSHSPYLNNNFDSRMTTRGQHASVSPQPCHVPPASSAFYPLTTSSATTIGASTTTVPQYMHIPLATDSNDYYSNDLNFLLNHYDMTLSHSTT